MGSDISSREPGKLRAIARDVPWLWLLCWVVLPNLVVIAMWPVGGPDMSWMIAFFGLLAIQVGFAKRRWVRYLSMMAIFVAILANYLTKSFNMSLKHIGGVHQYIMELDPVRSPEYLVAGIALAASFLIAMFFGPRREWAKTNTAQLSAVALIAVLALVDFTVTYGTRGSYKASAPEGLPVTSASLQNDIAPETMLSDNLVVVVVESWGVPNNDFDRAVDADIWRASQWDERYEVSRGTTPYYGSTTNAEVRELCGSWADHADFDFDHLGADCLPQRFAEQGFRTVAMHSFDELFFQRYEWYPKIGFQEAYFERSLLQNGAEFCDGVFGGACDRDIPAQITRTLQTSPSERNLVYWLTVNAHLPVSADPRLGTDPCRLGDEAWRDNFPMLCRSYAVHEQVAKALTEEIMRDDFPEADILIVGDHMPPFFPRNIRSRFDTRHVPWLYLRSRSSGEPEGEMASEAVRGEHEAAA